MHDDHLNMRGAALVTGAGRGIGRAIALVLAECGHPVAVNDADAERAVQTVGLIRHAGGRAACVPGDVSSEDDVASIVEHMVGQLGEPWVLVNNAAVLSVSRILQLDPPEWERTMAVNLRGPFLCCQAVARRMVAAGAGGRIVNIASEVGKTPQAGVVHYSASKAGLIALTQGLALELAPHGITVNSVCPTLTETPMIAGFGELLARALGGEAEHYERDLLAAIPMGRFCRPSEVAAVVEFLVSDKAGFVTGASYNVTGGKEVH